MTSETSTPVQTSESKSPETAPTPAPGSLIQFNEEDIRRTLRRALILAGAAVLVASPDFMGLAGLAHMPDICHRRRHFCHRNCGMAAVAYRHDVQDGRRANPSSNGPRIGNVFPAFGSRGRALIC